MKFFNIVFFSVLVFLCNPLGASTKTNPDISVNVLLLGKKTFSEKEKHHHTEGEDSHKDHGGHGHENSVDSHIGEGFSVQEVEFYFKSNIDPYWTGNVSLGISQHGRNFELDLEEAYVESLFIPHLTLKMGKFYAFLGRHNNLHTHYYPFIDPPLVNQSVFGFHGWNSTGLSLAYLAPLPWYSEIILQGFYVGGEKRSNATGIVFLKNFWDLSSASTLEWNLSYGAGVNSFRDLYNTALVLKWNALESSKTHSLSWTTEWLKAVGDSSSELDKEGLSSYLQWQFLKKWQVEGRAEYLFHKKWTDISAQKYSFLIAFLATEYSALRVQYDVQKSDHGDWAHSVAVQSNMSLGTHPAHLY